MIKDIKSKGDLQNEPGGHALYSDIWFQQHKNVSFALSNRDPHTGVITLSSCCITTP